MLVPVFYLVLLLLIKCTNPFGKKFSFYMFLHVTEVTQDQQNRYNSPRGITCTSTEKASQHSYKSVSRDPSSVDESAIPHSTMSCGKGAVHIQSGSSSWSAGYGDSSSSNCFLSASLCMCLMASAKAVGLESTSLFRMPPHPALGMAGEPGDIGVPQLDLGQSPVLVTIQPPWVSPGVGHLVVGHHAW